MPLAGLMLMLLALLVAVAMIALHYRNRAFVLGFCFVLTVIGIPCLLLMLLDGTPANVQRNTEHLTAPAANSGLPLEPAGPAEQLSLTLRQNSVRRPV